MKTKITHTLNTENSITIKVLKVSTNETVCYSLLCFIEKWHTRRTVCGVWSDDCQNVVFKTIIMVEINDSRILQHLEN